MSESLDRDAAARLVRDIVATYDDARGINHLAGLPIPDGKAIIGAVEDLRFILFPGFTDSRPVDRTNIEFVVGDLLTRVYTVFRREIETALRYRCALDQCPEGHCGAVAHRIATELLEAIPRIRETLKTDVEAAFRGDPAAKSFDEIILAYPGIRAICMHRIAHELYAADVPLVPRIIAEHAHSLTGIDIHPGARIGQYFFIDHGTGIVVGETAVIGENVKMYMGVTLGALAPAKGQVLRDARRHPTIEDDVTLYAGATILGGDTVIGQGSTVGGNVWLTHSIPPGTKVVLGDPDLVMLEKKAAPAPAAKDAGGAPAAADTSRAAAWSCPGARDCTRTPCPRPGTDGAAG
ncbi:MAG: serine O-acetyltransferase EpsC [Planctomycetota bacterium]